MIINTLDNSKTYMKGTLLQVLKEHSTEELPLPHSYSTILRRERMGVKFYTTVRRDPYTGYRLYSGADVRRIVKYELQRAAEEKHEREKRPN